MYQLGIARKESDIESFISTWKSSISDSRDLWPHHTIEWAESLRKLVSADQEFLYAYIQQDGQLTHVLPLVSSKIAKKGITFKVLSLACHPHSRYSDVITVAPNTPLDINQLQTALKPLLKGYTAFFGKAIPAESALMPAVQTNTASSFHTTVSNCDVIDVSSMTSSEDNVSKNFRNNLRKSAKKFAKLENFELETSRQPQDLPRLLEEFLQVEGSGWKAQQGSAIAQDQTLVDFYKRIIHGNSTQLESEISIIRVEGQPISGQLSVICEGTQYLLKIGYDEKFEKLAPGRYHLKVLLDELIQQDTIKTLNLMSDARWHAGWNPKLIPIANVLVAGPGLIGKLLVFALKLKQRLDARKESTQETP